MQALPINQYQVAYLLEAKTQAVEVKSTPECLGPMKSNQLQSVWAHHVQDCDQS